MSLLSPSPRWQWSTRLVVSVLMLAFAVLVLYRFRSLLTPLVLALMLSYILNPVVGYLVRRRGLPRGLAVLVVYLVLIVVVLSVTTAIGVVLGQQVVGLIADIRAIAAILPERVAELSQSSFQIGPFPLDLSQIDFAPLLEQLTGAIQPILSQTGSIIGSIASATASVVGIALLVLVLGYYMLHDFPDFGDSILSVAPQPYRPDVERLVRETSRVWSSFLRGQLILAVVIGVAVTALATLLGLRFQLALGLLSGLLEFIPIFGPLIAGVVGVLVALFQNANWLGLSPIWYAVLVAGMYLLVQQVENNILVPRIIGGSLNLHPLAVLIGAVAGGVLAGVLGLLLAAPVIATLRIWGRYLYRKVLDLNPFPEPTPTAPSALARAARRNFWARLAQRRERPVTADEDT